MAYYTDNEIDVMCAELWDNVLLLVDPVVDPVANEAAVINMLKEDRKAKWKETWNDMLRL